MSFRHGKDTVFLLGGNDLSQYANDTSFGDETEANETTTYGNSRKTYKAGLGDGKITVSGIYDDGASGPRAIIKPLKAIGDPVTYVLRPEGTGSGRAQSSVSVIITAYNESLPVADVISWTCELQMTGTLNETDQA